MITDQAEIERDVKWSRMPRCPSCSDLMVAPEASVLGPDGDVSHLWTCDSCGQGFVTRARSRIPAWPQRSVASEGAELHR
jgi:hypothetical protein